MPLPSPLIVATSIKSIYPFTELFLEFQPCTRYLASDCGYTKQNADGVIAPSWCDFFELII